MRVAHVAWKRFWFRGSLRFCVTRENGVCLATPTAVVSRRRARQHPKILLMPAARALATNTFTMYCAVQCIVRALYYYAARFLDECAPLAEP
jgi:hypothetical protein